MQLKLILGYLLAFLIGVGCRLLDIPLPAPTALLGAAIVLALTSGFLLTDKLMDAESGRASE